MGGFRLVGGVLAVACMAVLIAPPVTRAQGRTPDDHLKAGIAHLEAGDFLLALMTLNEVVSPDAKADPSRAARAHAYRAQAYLGLDNLERARAAATLALESQHDIDVTSPPFSAALVALFDDVRRTSTLDPEAAGTVAEKAGRFEEAFRAYLRAYQALPDPVPAEDDRRLRERIIEVSLFLPNQPAISEAATAHFAKATQFIEAEALLGESVGSSEAAVAELRKALRLAPWWPEATLKLAGVLQKTQRVEEALMNLNLYRIADPVGYAAAVSRKTAVPPAAERRAAAPPVGMPSVATVHIYWPPQSRGGGRPKVYCDGFHVADLQKSRFIVLDVTPGTHAIRFHNTTETFSFEAGGKYYVRTSAEGFPVKGVMRPVPAEDGEAEMRTEGVTSNDPRRTYATACTAPAPAGRQKR